MSDKYSDERRIADEPVDDRLHLALLDLILPGHAVTAADRARARARVAPLVERVVEHEGERGGGIG